MSVFRPSWFSNETVMVSTAPTCGLTKGGRLLFKVDSTTGKPMQTIDPDTGAPIEAIDDQLLADMEALSNGEQTDTLQLLNSKEIDIHCAVPVYYDNRFTESFREEMLKNPTFQGFFSATLSDLQKMGIIELRNGHGSPSHAQRTGEVPYIKVSDLRAGLVNINPTNRVPSSVAEHFWKGPTSRLQPFDLICPERTSKNIGDFCVLMPGQEQVVTTKEVIVLRPGPKAEFDAFYLLWAMTLNIVRNQWKRIVFMQTNREDVGKRYLEIEIPVAPTKDQAYEISNEFRNYFTTMAMARISLGEYLASSGAHHFFVSGDEPDENPTPT